MRTKPNFYITILLLLLVFISTANTNQTIKLSECDVHQPNPQSSVPKWLKLSNDQIVHSNNFENWIKKQFSLPESVSFVLLSTDVDKLGMTHLRYQQAYKGVLIEGTMVIAHSKNGKLISFNGNAASDFSLGTIPNILESVALSNALKAFPSKQYFWEDTQIKQTKSLLNEMLPKGELVITPINRDLKNLKLAYKFEILSAQPLKGAFIYIDALTGEKVLEKPAMLHVDETGTAETKYSGTRTIKTTKNNSGKYVLKEDERGGGIETRDLRVQVGQQQANGNFTSYDFEDDDNYWNNVNAQLDEAATDAHWGAEMTYDYFFDEHGRNSIDGNGIKLMSYVHLNTNGQPNAFWLPNKNAMFYGEGQGIALTFIDVSAHEITHGLTSHSANLEYQGESGALNESYSDIFGKTIENYARPNNWSWEIGIDGGNALRSMSSPGSKGHPDTYKGSNWVNTNSQDDNGGVHTNSGVSNHWYYLLVEGGTGSNDNNDAFSVTGIGWEKAGAIAFRNLTVYLSQYSDFNDARQFSIQSATDLYGGCSDEVIAVTNAWHAVGVGDVYQVGVANSDFEAAVTEGCVTPTEIEFTNTSTNGANAVWDFGDGVTSTDLNPTHIYQAEGLYTVKLKVFGDCGVDSILKTDYINIDTDLPCVLSMAVNSRKSFTSCSGVLYDTGGENGDYDNNNDSYFTISPPNASKVTIEFISFDVEAGDQGQGICNYDHVSVYDGVDENSTELNKFCGTNTPQLNSGYSSTGGDLTILLHADPYENGSGFQINWYCEEITTNIFETQEKPISVWVTGNSLHFNEEGVQYKLFDLNGKIIKEGIYSKPVQLAEITSGIYIIKGNYNQRYVNNKVLIR